MSAIKWVDTAKLVREARQVAVQARLEMFAAFAELQLDVQATHTNKWDAISVRTLEQKIDNFKNKCRAYRDAEDGIIVAMSTDAGRIDAAVPSPSELTEKGASAWPPITDEQVGEEVLHVSAGGQIASNIDLAATDHKK